jgi:hypothetical protein
MSNLSISLPAARTAFVFGRQVAQSPVDFEVTHFAFRSADDLPEFVFSLRTLSQQIEIWPTRAEVLQIIQFLIKQVKSGTKAPGHVTDQNEILQ